MSNRVYFVSLGCPKNQVDTEVMLGQTDKLGMELVSTPEEADTIVVNTCGFIDSAKEESIDTILEMAQYKQGNCSKLVVTGCLTQRFPDEVAQAIPEIDVMLGSGNYEEFAGAIQRTPELRKSLPVIRVPKTPDYLYDHGTTRVLTGARHSAYVKIAEGCDRPCGFCIIPKLRGAQRSRTIDSIVEEIADLAMRGVKEVNLIAQDLTRYGADLEEPRPNLAQLLRAIGPIKKNGLSWVRLHYTYPTEFSDELIAAIAETDVVAKYIDVPLQHIDDYVLKRMRRGHTSKVTYNLIERLRANIPGVVLRSTFIVGHPGESEEAFQKLCSFLREARLDHVGVFPYSVEEGTASAELTEEFVAHEVALERQATLMEIQRQIAAEKNEQRVGTAMTVLVDGISSENDWVLKGRYFGQAPSVDGQVYLSGFEAKAGDFVSGVVTQSTDFDLCLEPAEF